MSIAFDLEGVFRRAEKAPAEFRIGTEVEKIGLHIGKNGPEPMHYEGEFGVHEVLNRMQRFGWKPESEIPGGPVLALTRDNASITLEPGSQFELSGAPLATLQETYDELLLHREEIQAVGKELDIRWLGIGFHPFAKRSDLTFVPKLRYSVMQKYLPTKGQRGLDMMLRTCTVQANLDYQNEADAMQKLWTSLRLQPIVTALFANSPYYEGQQSKRHSERADVWLSVDPTRSGLIPSLWEKSPSALRYQDYIEWALDAPMFLIKRNNEVVHNTGQTFRAFLADGFEGHSATENDWETHLNTLFPEARLKRTLEMRGADSQNAEGCTALAALWKGLLYGAETLSKATAFCAGWTHDEVEKTRHEIPTATLSATLQGKPLQHYAEEIVALAESGLAQNERHFLEPLRTCLAAGQSLGEWRLAAMRGDVLALEY